MEIKKTSSIEQKIIYVTTGIFFVFIVGACVSFCMPPIGVVSNFWLCVGAIAVTANLVANIIKLSHKSSEDPNSK